MKNNAILLHKAHQNPALVEPLLQTCRDLKIAVETIAIPDPCQTIAELLPAKSTIVFIPALEEDCLGIKIAQYTLDDAIKRVLVMYAPSLPAKQYICLAFREGIDDIITFDTSRESWPIQIRRAQKLLQNRIQSLDLSGQLQQQIEQLHQRCEQLERSNARWEERIVSLAATASRMATGELSLPQTAPQLLIVTESASQAQNAAELARKLGFLAAHAVSAAAALEEIKKHPPRIILTSTTLPDMELTAFAHAARHALQNQPVMIVAWSSSPQAEDKLLEPETGIDDFILKAPTPESANMLVTVLLSSLR